MASGPQIERYKILFCTQSYMPREFRFSNVHLAGWAYVQLKEHLLLVSERWTTGRAGI